MKNTFLALSVVALLAAPGVAFAEDDDGPAGNPDVAGRCIACPEQGPVTVNWVPDPTGGSDKEW